MTKKCTICGEEGEEINWHYGAISCIACKKFFYRSETEPRGQYTCSGNLKKKCKITVENRATCKLCRFLKCLSSGMNLDLKSQDLPSNELIQATACAVCGELSSGIHFGVATCEACKSFFRRSFSNKSMAQPRKYRCVNGSKASAEKCAINKITRQICRHCRLEKCLNVGMSIESIHLGRQTNIFKHQVMENSKYSLPIKHKAVPFESSPENTDHQVRQPKRVRLTNSDNSLDYSDSASSSSSSSSSASFKLPVHTPSNSEMVYAKPPTNLNRNEGSIYQRTYLNTQTKSNYSYLCQPEASPYYYSAYDQFLANTQLSQMYTKNLINNFNSGVINENTYASNSTVPFLFGNQYNYTPNTQPIQSYPYVNSYFINQDYAI